MCSGEHVASCPGEDSPKKENPSVQERFLGSGERCSCPRDHSLVDGFVCYNYLIRIKLAALGRQGLETDISIRVSVGRATPRFPRLLASL